VVDDRRRSSRRWRSGVDDVDVDVEVADVEEGGSSHPPPTPVVVVVVAVAEREAAAGVVRDDPSPRGGGGGDDAPPPPPSREGGTAKRSRRRSLRLREKRATTGGGRIGTSTPSSSSRTGASGTGGGGGVDFPDDDDGGWCGFPATEEGMNTASACDENSADEFKHVHARPLLSSGGGSRSGDKTSADSSLDIDGGLSSATQFAKTTTCEETFAGEETTPSVDDEDSANPSTRAPEEGAAVVAKLPGGELERKTRSSLAAGEENASNHRVTTIWRPSSSRSSKRRRRDTFDLSRRRGLALVGPRKRVAGLSVLVDEEVTTSSNHAASDDRRDYVTPRAGSVEVDVEAMAERILRTLDDGRSREDEGRRRREDDGGEDDDDAMVDDDGEGGPEDDSTVAARHKLDCLTSATIEERMRDLFPDKMGQVRRYPCVSARIFAAMSAVYADGDNFAPLLPFLASLVDAEIVSLVNKHDENENEVLFIGKRVCFSGFDCSSTTTAVGAVVGQGGGDLGTSVEALEAVLRCALELPRPAHHLGVAIRCLRRMGSCGGASDACAETMVGYFPGARFRRALKHYADELNDVKRFLTSQSDARPGVEHAGVRYRLDDFIGRTIRYHLRELLNSIPASVVDFNVDKCAERWGRAVDDRSISSILNFALEKVHELATYQPEIFDRGVQDMPIFFAREASTRVHSMSRDGLKRMDASTFEGIVMDVVEARSFLFCARACKFVLDLLNCSAVREHVDASVGWTPVEAMASTFYKLNLHEGSDNGHFVQLRVVRELITVSRSKLCDVRYLC
jgi:hypothetical protein